MTVVSLNDNSNPDKLSLNFGGLNGSDLRKGYRHKKERDQELAEQEEITVIKADRKRVKTAFEPNSLSEKIFEAMDEGYPYATIEIAGTSGKDHPRGPISKTVLDELNQQILNNPILDKVTYDYKELVGREGDEASGFHNFAMASCAVISILAGIGSAVAASTFVGPGLLGLGAGALGFVGGGITTFAATALPTDYVSNKISALFDANYSKNNLRVYFNDPRKLDGNAVVQENSQSNKATLSIPARAINAVSQFARELGARLWGKEITNPSKFRSAAHNLAESIEEFQVSIEGSDLDFTADINKLLQYADRNADIIGNRVAQRSLLHEKGLVRAMNTLAKSMDDLSKFATLDKEHVSLLQEGFHKVMNSLVGNVTREEENIADDRLGTFQISTHRLRAA